MIVNHKFIIPYELCGQVLSSLSSRRSAPSPSPSPSPSAVSLTAGLAPEKLEHDSLQCGLPYGFFSSKETSCAVCDSSGWPHCPWSFHYVVMQYWVNIPDVTGCVLCERMRSPEPSWSPRQRHNANHTSILQVNERHERDAWQQDTVTDRQYTVDVCSEATLQLSQLPSLSHNPSLHLSLSYTANWGTIRYYFHHPSIAYMQMFLWNLRIEFPLGTSYVRV